VLWQSPPGGKKHVTAIILQNYSTSTVLHSALKTDETQHPNYCFVKGPLWNKTPACHCHSVAQRTGMSGHTDSRHKAL